jgi:hypothetical protein
VVRVPTKHRHEPRQKIFAPAKESKSHILITQNKIIFAAMNDPKRLFHLVSYLQYPFMLLGLFYCCKPVLTNFDTLFTNLDALLIEFNKALVFIGLGASLSTLQDTTKVQNRFSQRIYNSPRKTTIFFVITTFYTVLFIIIGMIGLFGSNKYLQELSFGLISLGVGFIGMLKGAIEIVDYQRKKQLTPIE